MFGHSVRKRKTFNHQLHAPQVLYIVPVGLLSLQEALHREWFEGLGIVQTPDGGYIGEYNRGY